MKNFLQSDENIVVTAPYARSSGDGVLVGSLFGVCMTDAAQGATVAIVTEGVVELPKVSAEVWTEGEKIYWHDGTVKQLTSSSSGNTYVGHAVLWNGAVAGSGATVGQIRLLGAY